MDNQLECPVCVLKYDAAEQQPIVGTCGHSICEQCWPKLPDKICPLCNKPGAFLNKTVNFGLKEQLQMMHFDFDTVQDDGRNDDDAINVVVVSETGVGKSTWINAIANYITYETAEEALAKPHINMIPTEFTISVKKDGEMLSTHVKVGEEGDARNEVHKEAASCTQHPRSYVFHHNERTYRLIDTPGLGDTRGPNQDRINIENIISFIAKFKKIHAICILLRPNEARLTPTFEYCFKEIIKQFHRSAVKNIMFCFTNTSGCDFCVGDTQRPLGVLIKSINERQNVNIVLDGRRMYPFDNMAYRYLCAKSMPDPVCFPVRLESLYKDSFLNSREETLRLFEYICSLEPHNTEESVTLFYVRNVIAKLTGPLAVITSKVNKTLSDIQEKRDEILSNKNSQKELRKTLMRKLKISHYELSTNLVHYCTGCSVRTTYHGEQRKPFIACDPTVANVDPLSMWTIKAYLERSDSICPRCRSRAKVVSSEKTYTYITEDKEEEDPNMRNRLNDKESLEKEAQVQLSSMKQLHKEISMEQVEIRRASAKFAYVMKKNCITTYNDVGETYIAMLIEVAQEKGRRQEEKSLKLQLDKYREEKRLYEDDVRLAEGDGNYQTVLGPKEIMEIANSLERLKHYGRDVSLALNSAHDRTNNVQYEELHYSVQTGVVEKSKWTTRLLGLLWGRR